MSAYLHLPNPVPQHCSATAPQFYMGAKESELRVSYIHDRNCQMVHLLNPADFYVFATISLCSGLETHFAVQADFKLVMILLLQSLEWLGLKSGATIPAQLALNNKYTKVQENLISSHVYTEVVPCLSKISLSASFSKKLNIRMPSFLLY